MSKGNHRGKAIFAKAVFAAMVSGAVASAFAVDFSGSNTYTGSAQKIGMGQTWTQTDTSLETSIKAWMYQGNSIQVSGFSLEDVPVSDDSGNSTHSLHIGVSAYVDGSSHDFSDFVFIDYNTVNKSLASSVMDGVITTTLTDSAGNALESTADISGYVGQTIKETAKDGTVTVNGKETTIEKAIESAGEEAAKHASVAAGDANVKVDGTAVNANGGTEYKVSLAEDITVKSAKIGSVTISGDTVSTGSTAITGTGVSAGNSELKTDSLKVNGREYITSDGISANSQKITNVAAGTLAADSADAVNGSQLYAANQRIEENSSSIANLYRKAGDLNKKINRTGANAAALAALHPLDYDEDHKVSAAVGFGHYHGSSSAALGLFVRPSENLLFSLGGSFSSSDRMLNAGAAYRFGSSAPGAASGTVSAEQMKAVMDENRDLSARLAAAESRVDALRAEIDVIKAQLKIR